MRGPGFRRIAVPQQIRSRARTVTYPPPTRGWRQNETIGFQQLGAATVLDNWVVELETVRTRGGTDKVATVGAPDAVTALWTYRTGDVSRLFAATKTAIYDISSVSDVNTSPTAAVSGRTDGAYSVANMSTAAGDFQYLVNEADKPLLYDGTSFTAIDGASSPAITGVTTTDLSHVWVFKNRLFFVQRGTRSAWYLPIDSIGGTASEFTLNGVFERGGSLLFGATFASDSGGGLDERCVFVSDQGEVAIFQGSDPSSASTWSLVGVYWLSEPLGKNAHEGIGGDRVIATTDGLVSLRQGMRVDRVSLSETAWSSPIERAWRGRVAARSNELWQVVRWPERGQAIVVCPDDGSDPVQFAANTTSLAWSRFRGWDAQAATVWDGDFVFGTSGGVIYKGDTASGSDDGTLYECRMALAHDMAGEPGRLKSAKSMRATFRAATSVNPRYSVGVDYQTEFPAAPPAATAQAASTWGSAVWGAAAWGAEALARRVNKWRSVTGHGYVVCPQIQISVSSAQAPDAELVSTTLMLESGDVQV